MAWGDPIPRKAIEGVCGTYGGNRISDSYLDAFDAQTDSWLRRIGARPKDKPSDGLPAGLAGFVESI